MKLVQKICKAKGCGKEYTGAPQSQFCSPNCRKVGKPKEGFISETVLIKSAENAAKEDAFRKEQIQKNAKRAILSLPHDKQPKVYIKPNLDYTIKDVKDKLLKSVTLDQIISNIASKHKYKNTESYVSHIEDMLIMHAENDA